MQYSTLLSVVAIAITSVSAADIRGSTGSSCQNARLACLGIQENICCNFNTNAINSISWTLPANSRGFGYIDVANCNNARRDNGAVVFGQVNQRCQQYLTSLGSAKWVVGTSGKVRRSAEENCVEPNAYAYIDGNGKEVWKDIKNGDYEKVKKYFLDDDNEGLAGL